MLIQQLQSDKKEWNEISRFLSSYPECSQEVENETGMAALHYAVCMRSPKDRLYRYNFVQNLLALYPGANLMRCKKRGFTPLAYACFSDDDDDATISDDADVIRLLLESSESAINMTSSEGLSPLSLHLIAISRLKASSSIRAMRQWQESSTSSSTAVLKLLIGYCNQSALESALSRLYLCNTSMVMQRFAREEIRARRNIQQFGRQTRASDALSDAWIWEWTLEILQGIHRCLHKDNNNAPFHALHVASRITDCPTPLLVLAMRAFPSEARAADRTSMKLPHHYVADWNIPEGMSACRKYMCLSALETEFPSGMRPTTNSGVEQPGQLLEMPHKSMAEDS